MFEFMVTLSILAFGSLVGFLFGEFESDRVTQSFHSPKSKKLPHGKLLTARIIICLLVSCATLGYTRDTLLMTAVMMVSLTITHRFTFNKGTDKPYWYMGLPLDLRDKDDSKYDTAMHLIASGLHLFNRKAPFWIATSLEAIAAVWLLYIFFTF